MSRIEKKIASISKRYDELVTETTLALTAMAEKGLRIEQEEAVNNNFFVANFRGEDCAFCGLKLDTLDSNNVVVLLMPLQGEEAHTITNVSLKYVSTEDRFYIAKYITDYFDYEPKIINMLEKKNNTFNFDDISFRIEEIDATMGKVIEMHIINDIRFGNKTKKVILTLEGTPKTNGIQCNFAFSCLPFEKQNELYKKLKEKNVL